MRSHSRPLAHDKLLGQGLQALSEREDDISEAQLASLEIGSAPPAGSGMDVDKPWWAMAMTTEPCFLRGDEAADCEMLMGLAPLGAPAPDWVSIQNRAIELFNERSIRAGLGVDLHFFIGQRDADCLDILCQGRVLRCSPAFGFQGFDSWGDHGKFNRRRAKRRERQPTPKSWEREFGSRAQILWAAGLSLARLPSQAFQDWPQTMSALRDAMLEHGASRVERCPGFFRSRRDLLEDDLAMQELDAQKLDALRSAWELDAIARRGHSKARGASL